MLLTLTAIVLALVCLAAATAVIYFILKSD